MVMRASQYQLLYILFVYTSLYYVIVSKDSFCSLYIWTCKQDGPKTQGRQSQSRARQGIPYFLVLLLLLW